MLPYSTLSGSPWVSKISLNKNIIKKLCIRNYIEKIFLYFVLFSLILNNKTILQLLVLIYFFISLFLKSFNWARLCNILSLFIWLFKFNCIFSILRIHYSLGKLNINCLLLFSTFLQANQLHSAIFSAHALQLKPSFTSHMRPVRLRAQDLSISMWFRRPTRTRGWSMQP